MTTDTPRREAFEPPFRCDEDRQSGILRDANGVSVTTWMPKPAAQWLCDRLNSTPPASDDTVAVPADPYKAFAWFVSRCAEGFGQELLDAGRPEKQTRNTIIHIFLDFAAGEACRVARCEGREPDPTKWQSAVNEAFSRAVERTKLTPCDEAATQRPAADLHGGGHGS